MTQAPGVENAKSAAVHGFGPEWSAARVGASIVATILFHTWFPLPAFVTVPEIASTPTPGYSVPPVSGSGATVQPAGEPTDAVLVPVPDALKYA